VCTRGSDRALLCGPSTSPLDAMLKRSRYPLPPLDIAGRRIRRGARVRIVGMPDLSGMRKPGRRSTEAVFRHICGTYKRVDSFDSLGCATIYFAIRRGAHRGLHSVAIEPYLLLLPSGSKRASRKHTRRATDGV
jgi:hypothetical protein